MGGLEGVSEAPQGPPSKTTPTNLEHVMQNSWGKLEAKNQELGEELFLLVGREERKTLLFPTPVTTQEPTASGEIGDVNHYLAVTKKGFIDLQVKGTYGVRGEAGRKSVRQAINNLSTARN